MSDNFHQSVQGGTGANHIMLGHGDAILFTDGNGHAKQPPHNVTVDPGIPTPASSTKSRIPTRLRAPTTGTRKTAMVAARFGSASYGGGSYTNCADPTQPGVSAIVKYLQSLPRPIDSHCEAGHYYLLNNYNPGYFGQGENAFAARIRIQHRLHHSAFSHAQHRRRASRPEHFVEVLWRSVERYAGEPSHAANPATSPKTNTRSTTARQAPQIPRRCHHERRRVLQHLQPLPVRHVDHDQRRDPHMRTFRTL